MIVEDVQGWMADGFEKHLLDDARKAQEHIELFRRIERDLLNAQLLNPPKVIFSTLLPKELVTELKALVQRHHGMVVLRPEEATHEIIPDLPPDDEEESDYCRTIQEQDRMTLVHWWYYPDSYREWKPQSEIEGKTEPAMPTPVLWKVQARFIKDLAKFNEWMNEEDFVIAADDDDDDDDDADRMDTDGTQEVWCFRDTTIDCFGIKQCIVLVTERNTHRLATNGSVRRMTRD